jgi:5'-phosphate synthase pdxT subunit
MKPLRIGVLAVQGNFREHGQMLRRLGADVVEVRKADQLDGLDGLVIPGGESTTFTRLMQLYGLDQPVRAVFIRAPWVEEVGPGVEVLAEIDGRPVLAREGRFLVAAFHPELTDDTRLHELFLESVREGRLVRA